MRDRSLRAFSLVELLIVIAVVFLLGGISVSGLQAARIPALLCPSDPSPRSHNYLFSIGDRCRGFWPGFRVPPADNAGFQASIRGLFGLQSRVRLESVRDGLSHTIAMSECVIPRGLGRNVPQHGSDAGIRYSDGQGEAVTNDRFAVSFGDESPSRPKVVIPAA